KKGGVFVEPLRRQEVELYENEEEHDADLNEVEKRFHVDPRRILVLVQEQGHRYQHILESKQESHRGGLGRFATEHHLVIHPAEVRGFEKMQRHNDGGKDQGLPRHSWWYFRLSGWISWLTYFRGVGEPLHSRSTDVPCPTRGLQSVYFGLLASGEAARRAPGRA